MNALFDFFHEDNPYERCGLIVGDEIIEVSNTHPEPEEGFEVDPAALIEYEGRMTGTWHTHPKGSSNLSQEDHNCFTQWPELRHFIIAKDGITEFVVIEGAVIRANHTPR